MHRQTPSHTVIAIDGTVGSGKSTVARRLADRLGLVHVDTGAMYRAVAWAARRAGLDPADVADVANLAQRLDIALERTADGQRVYCDGTDITDAIRTPEVSRDVVTVADNVQVRRQLVALQRQLGEAQPVVMEGRDIATVVFPDAQHKFFLDADLEVRAERRYRELLARGKAPSRAEVRRDVEERDRRDRIRPTGGLRVAEGARTVDTTGMGIEDVVQYLAAAVGAPVRPGERGRSADGGSTVPASR